jgi:phospholipid/cholesterol/gamma-HCH transport system substrate-binding protein
MKRSTFITWDQLKVGVVILTALGILTVAIVKLGDAAQLFKKRYTLVAILPNANGLRVGGGVQIAGQLSGTVQAIDFLPVDNDTTRNLRVTLEIDQTLQPHVRADSRARLRTLGLLGDKVIDISPGTARYNALRPGDTLQLAQSTDYDAVLQQASGAVGDLVQLTSDLKNITGGIVRGEGTLGQIVTDRSLYDELTTTLTRTNQLMGRLQNPNGTVGRLLDDPALYDNLAKMITSVDSLVVALNSPNGTTGRLLRDTTIYNSLRSVAAGGDSLVRQLREGDGLANKLLTDQQLYDQLVKAVTDLNAILADVRRDPRRYTRGLIKVF